MIGRLLCWLGWHRPTEIGLSGLNTTAVCRRCGRMIMRDSNGNWF